LLNKFKENSSENLEIYIFISNGDIDIKKVKTFAERNLSNESTYFKVLNVNVLIFFLLFKNKILN
jgi:hypothetical protein